MNKERRCIVTDGESREERTIRLRRSGKETLARLLEVVAQMQSHQDDDGTKRIEVNKRTHLIRYENETEEPVTIVIEKRGNA